MDKPNLSTDVYISPELLANLQWRDALCQPGMYIWLTVPPLALVDESVVLRGWGQ